MPSEDDCIHISQNEQRGRSRQGKRRARSMKRGHSASGNCDYHFPAVGEGEQRHKMPTATELKRRVWIQEIFKKNPSDLTSGWVSASVVPLPFTVSQVLTLSAADRLGEKSEEQRGK